MLIFRRLNVSITGNFWHFQTELVFLYFSKVYHMINCEDCWTVYFVNSCIILNSLMLFVWQNFPAMNAGMEIWSLRRLIAVLLVSVTRASLFAHDEPISQLQTHNFSSVIHNSKKMWIVDFYASWCGYCQRLAPEFSSMARDIQGEFFSNLLYAHWWGRTNNASRVALFLQFLCMFP